MTDKLKFPEGFLWGAATASYQVEGGIENCDWAEAARDGKVPECGQACDHYNRYEEDFDIAKTLGHNAHRFSVEWARIEPEEGKFNDEAIEHYREVLRALHERGMTPMVTLWHFTLPVWFSKSGGWERKDAPEVFARYCAHVVHELGDAVKNYSTINEPMVVAGIGYIRGRWPPFGNKAFLRYFKMLTNMARGHGAAYRAIKKEYPNKEVGIVKHTIPYMAGKNPLHKIAAWFSNLGWTYLFMSRVHKECDWIGLNYYNRKVFGETRTLEKTDMGWNIDPEGIYDALQILKKYKKPIYIAEAGCADASDKFRTDYIRDTIRAIHHAVRNGVKVKGYCYWSLLDNYEWAEGFGKRFGLVEVNYDTLERTIRPSAYVYKEICETNSVGSN
jgi:beta-glucosidase